jgi:2'-5' RNA ligase
VEGLGRFDKKVIYLSIKKSNEIVEINRLVNGFLRDYCDELFDDYSPENWIPHVTLAMEDLPERNFETAWNEIRDYAIKFKQTLHNICLVKKHPNGRIGIAKRCGL